MRTNEIADTPSPATTPSPTDPANEARGRNLLRLLELKGIGKQWFASLGGGENFIRSERQAFADAIEKQEPRTRLAVSLFYWDATVAGMEIDPF